MIRFYKSLSPSTRLLVGGGLIAYATFGLFLSNIAEKKFDLVPTEEDKRKLNEMVPKVRVIEK
jgi:hypothetical protein